MGKIKLCFSTAFTSTKPRGVSANVPRYPGIYLCLLSPASWLLGLVNKKAHSLKEPLLAQKDEAIGSPIRRRFHLDFSEDSDYDSPPWGHMFESFLDCSLNLVGWSPISQEGGGLQSKEVGSGRSLGGFFH